MAGSDADLAGLYISQQLLFARYAVRVKGLDTNRRRRLQVLTALDSDFSQFNLIVRHFCWAWLPRLQHEHVGAVRCARRKVRRLPCRLPDNATGAPRTELLLRRQLDDLLLFRPRLLLDNLLK